MEVLFINSDEKLDTFSENLSRKLDIEGPYEGDSTHVLGGVYFAFRLMGMQIKLENNSYDYEDDFNIMISVERDVVAGSKLPDGVLEKFTEFFVRLLHFHFQTPIGYEIGEDLILYDPEVGKGNG